MISRTQVLENAKRVVNGQREMDYGTPESNFRQIADLWGVYLGKKLSAADVAAMMILLKIARMSYNGGTEDCYVDIAGYAACGGEVWSMETEDSSRISGILISPDNYPETQFGNRSKEVTCVMPDGTRKICYYDCIRRSWYSSKGDPVEIEGWIPE